MDKLTSMVVFTKVAKAGSFAAAAKELGLSRAMATKHVMQLENSLGVRLLNRTTRHLSLTEVGMVYLERCLQILDDLEETELAVTRLQTEPRGTLKLNAAPFFGAYHLAPAIAAYLEIYPDVNVELVLQAGYVDLVEEGFDLAIHLDELRDSSLIARKLGTSQRIVCGAPGYFEKRGVPKTPEDLKKHNCLSNSSLPPRDQWQFVSQDGKSTVIKVSGTLEANSADALRMAAISGLGLVLLPTYMVGQDIRKGRLQAVLTDYVPAAADIHAVYPHRKHLSAKVRTFVDFLHERFHPTPYWEEWMHPESGEMGGQ
ncbi:LysR family transcriptional regulator [Methylococcus capsulatus]|mgnify:CR=1 FL=1|uniref:LysR family transcriptional regulator n=1 Tax=Methylococcus capsulatus TaxID=414 RepID=UPI001C53237E|nr:LysR family transcriptional regulator [Methylococcus capsulatus]QXP86971.1 LysR family transcriptional regulator [Methylococcus capsulatus]QXP91682.1 LysR family transcriptional regulator [Methylococcus capsulatus]QXP93349.1 LysR family transcriptional regulator [Methylococcus capsulatus]UQN11953.1 LysR family transcriptional regulator [Methylococcus capsulatus]